MIHLSRFLAQITVGIQNKQLKIEIKPNQLILLVLWCLYKNGYIVGYFVKENYGIVYLKYFQGKEVLSKLEQISRISKRIFIQYKYLEKYNNFLHKKVVITTTKGIDITQSMVIRKQKNCLGGEILFKIQ